MKSAEQRPFDTFQKHLVEMYNKHFPNIEVNRKYHDRKLWLPGGSLKTSIEQKNKHYLKFKTINSAQLSDDVYKSNKRKLRQVIKVSL